MFCASHIRFQKSNLRAFFHLISLFICSVSTASPVRVLLLDSFVDSDHPALIQSFDVAAMSSLQSIDFSGKKESWLSLNEKYHALVQSELGSVHHILLENSVVEQSRRTPRPLSLSHFTEQHAKGVSAGLLREYVHGTLAASVMIQENPEIRLLQYPARFEMRRAFTQVHKYGEGNLDRLRSLIRAQFLQLSSAIQAHQIRIVNTSQLLEAQNLLRSGFFKAVFAGKDFSLEKSYQTILQEELQTFIQAHPQTIFILSAGSQGVALAGTTHLVSATDSTLAPAFVANVLARILIEKPKLSAQQALEALYAERVYVKNELRDRVQGGRVLWGWDHARPAPETSTERYVRKSKDVVRQCRQIFKELLKKMK